MRNHSLSRLLALPLMVVVPAESRSCPPKPNWDRITWGMSPEELQSVYGLGEIDGNYAYFPVEKLKQSSPLSNISSHKMKFAVHFTQGKVDSVTIYSKEDYRTTIAIARSKFGQQIYGQDNEDHCFDVSGKRMRDKNNPPDIVGLCAEVAMFRDYSNDLEIKIGATGWRSGFGWPYEDKEPIIVHFRPINT